MTETRRIEDIRIEGRHRRDMGDIEGLARSMNELGLLHPVAVTPDNLLIAGERRILAARMLGWDVIPVHVVDLAELLRAERDENMVRKDFTPTEAVAIGRALEPMEREAAQARMMAGQPSVKFTEGKGQSLDKVAAAVGMSRPTYAKAAAVVDAAEREPERFGDLAAKMDESGMVDKAHKEMVVRERQAERERLMQEIAAVPQSERWHVEQADIRTYQTTQRFDFIITDPPYPREYLDLYGVLAERALEWLKPGGSLLVMVGQSYLPEILGMIAPIIRYQWTLAYLTPGGQSVQLWQRKVNTFWKPVLWFTHGEYKGHWIGDVTRSAPNDNDKTHHIWGQSESGMADLIERFTLPGHTIFDPFCGGGTTGVVAVALGRLFYGIDTDADALETTKGRLWAIQTEK
jgi:ParB-like chromosome segregation protein Spo0J